MSRPEPSTKRDRLMMRVIDLEDKLARLVPDLPGEYVEHADEALRHMKELRERL